MKRFDSARASQARVGDTLALRNRGLITGRVRAMTAICILFTVVRLCGRFAFYCTNIGAENCEEYFTRPWRVGPGRVCERRVVHCAVGLGAGWGCQCVCVFVCFVCLGLWSLVSTLSTPTRPLLT